MPALFLDRHQSKKNLDQLTLLIKDAEQQIMENL